MRPSQRKLCQSETSVSVSQLCVVACEEEEEEEEERGGVGLALRSTGTRPHSPPRTHPPRGQATGQPLSPLNFSFSSVRARFSLSSPPSRRTGTGPADTGRITEFQPLSVPGPAVIHRPVCCLPAGP
ncbi:hypothetical protein ILYODFUR_026664 [Ilyodon furcidens]|uniref:Uncharacterized protein n=1 Tax=Ilyodon furcidens TaxID=33524 RepID=A0ABV0T2P1_9TELE